MKGRARESAAVLSILVISSIWILLGSSLAGEAASAANVTNESVLSRLYVWNTEPVLYDLTVTPSIVDLDPGSTFLVNCTGSFWDYNGWEDVANGTVNATLYDISNGYNASTLDDNNYHYTNGSCNQCSEIGTSFTNGTCTCFFEVYYYANNGTWQCNMSVTDSGGNATEREINMTSVNSMKANTTINTILGIDVQDVIDFENLSVTEVSRDIIGNITNIGNVLMNVSVRGYAGSNDDPTLSMVCDLGNISISSLRYSTANGTAYDNMTQLTGTYALISNYTIDVRTNDSNPFVGQDRNESYWKLSIPLSVGGSCNGTLEFSANDAS